MGISSHQTAEQAEAVAAAARQALNIAEEGTQMVEQTLNQLLDLRESVVAIAQQNYLLDDGTSQLAISRL